MGRLEAFASASSFLVYHARSASDRPFLELAMQDEDLRGCGRNHEWHDNYPRPARHATRQRHDGRDHGAFVASHLASCMPWCVHLSLKPFRPSVVAYSRKFGPFMAACMPTCRKIGKKQVVACACLLCAVGFPEYLPTMTWCLHACSTSCT
jgi:hypothetical protein